MMPLPHRLDRTITIQATREIVFRFFTDEGRWASWWGAGSTIDARPGGRLLIRYPGGVEALGEVLEVRPPERIVFTYGYASEQPIPPGSSRVTIALEAQEGGTKLRVSHEFAEASVRDAHVQGWRYQLSLFANLVANEVNAGAAALVDAWFATWREPDAHLREQLLTRAVEPAVRFRDQYSAVEGVADLVAHIGGYQHAMPGIRLERVGEIRHCQGMVLANWTGSGGSRGEMTGTNVFVLGTDGRITAVTGFWNAPAQGR